MTGHLVTTLGGEMDDHTLDDDEVAFCDDAVAWRDRWHDEEDDYPEEETPWWELYFR